MAEPKWTKGPWRLGDDALHGKALTIWAAQPGVCITSVFDASMGPDAPPMREALANARLAAAAPELYDALERILRMPINGVPLRDWEDYNIKEALGILAKARGKW